MNKRIRHKLHTITCCSHCDFIKNHEYDEEMVCKLKMRCITFGKDCINCKNFNCKKNSLKEKREMMKSIDKFMRKTYPEDYVPF